MEELSFNVDHGYLEGLVRGMKAGILTQADYQNLTQCDSLEGRSIYNTLHVWMWFSFTFHVYVPSLRPAGVLDLLYLRLHLNLIYETFQLRRRQRTGKSGKFKTM